MTRQDFSDERTGRKTEAVSLGIIALHQTLSDTFDISITVAEVSPNSQKKDAQISERQEKRSPVERARR